VTFNGDAVPGAAGGGTFAIRSTMRDLTAATRHQVRVTALIEVIYRPLAPSLPPKILEPVRRQFDVPDGVLNVLVPKIGLQ
jgi:hypothetical protein